MPALSEIVFAVVAGALVIGLMVGWCVGAWRNRIVYRDEDGLTSTPERRYREAGE